MSRKIDKMAKHRWAMIAKWSAIGAVGILLAAGLCSFMGSVVVVDQDGQIISATIIASDGATQPLYRMPVHIWAAAPRIEGDIAIRCRDGSASRGGYVTPHQTVWIKIKSDGSCGKKAV
jgi:hypothetical protein